MKMIIFGRHTETVIISIAKSSVVDAFVTSCILC